MAREIQNLKSRPAFIESVSKNIGAKKMDGITKLHITAISWLVVLFGLVVSVNPGFASDMCMFSVTADDLPPNIVILIDNGA